MTRRTIVNVDVARLSGQIFAHTAAYQVPAYFANRIAEQEALRAFLAEDAGRARAAVVSDLLGSGKTFLVEMALRSINKTDTGMLLCGAKEVEMEKAAQVRGFVGVDEWDIKAPPKTLIKAAERLQGYFSTRSEAVPVILIGDRTIQSNSLRSFLDGIDLVDIKMEPLNSKFFGTALRERLKGTFEGNEAAEDQQIVAPELIAALVPDWTETVAVFREVLRALKEMADRLPSDNNPAMIGREQAKDWLASLDLSALRQQQSDFYNNFIEHHRRLANFDKLEPYTLEDLRNFTSAVISEEALAEEIMLPLSRSGLFGAIGKPSFSVDGEKYQYVRYPGPYLPSPKTLVRVIYGEHV